MKKNIELQIESLYHEKKKERERIDQFILEQEEFIERINRDIISLQEEMEEKDHIVLDEPIDYERLKELAESESNENFLNQLYMLIKDSKELKFQKKNILISLLLGNENVPERIIICERKKDYLMFNNQIASNPKTPQYLLEDLFFSESRGYKLDRRHILLNPSITKKIMLEVVRKKDIQFYGYLISNKSTLEEVLMILTSVLIEEKEVCTADDELALKSVDEMLNAVLVHPNVSERIINIIKASGGIRNSLAISDKRFLLIESFTYANKKHLISPVFYNKNTGLEMELVKETLEFSKSELLEMKRSYSKTQNFEEYIEWVETLGYSFREEI